MILSVIVTAFCIDTFIIFTFVMYLIFLKKENKHRVYIKEVTKNFVNFSKKEVHATLRKLTDADKEIIFNETTEEGLKNILKLIDMVEFKVVPCEIN